MDSLNAITSPQKRANDQKWRAANPEKVREQARKYYVANREKSSERSRRWASANPEKVHAHKLKRITSIREYNREYARKRQGLPVPTRPMPELCERNCGRKALCLDHCHTTGAFRGWLCNACNRGIGMLGDTVKDLLEAIDYLQGTKL